MVLFESYLQFIFIGVPPGGNHFLGEKMGTDPYCYYTQFYLDWLKNTLSIDTGCAVHAYVLMTNRIIGVGVRLNIIYWNSTSLILLRLHLYQ